MKPDARQREGLDLAVPFDEELGAGLEPLLRKIRVETHDDLAANPVRSSNAPDTGHLIPLH